MTTAFEKMVDTINTTTSAFALAGDMKIFQAGLADLSQTVNQMQADITDLKARVAALEVPAPAAAAPPD